MNYSLIANWCNQNQGLVAIIIFLLSLLIGGTWRLFKLYFKRQAPLPISMIDGEHRAKGKGNITGIDAQEPVIFKPGTKSIAEGEGTVTATRIGSKNNARKEAKK
jgi:hypothetical protein